MTRPRGFPRRFRFPWRSTARIRRDVDDELAFHLVEKTAALERQGMTPEDARAEALRQFGDLEAAREELVAADRRGERRLILLILLDDLARDVRLAWRSLWRTPGFTAVAVLVLALGIGVVSGAASLVNVIGLKPAMMNAPDEVFGVFAMRQEPPRAWRFFSYPEYEEIRDRAGAFSGVAAFDIIDAGVDGGGIGRRGQVSFVSASYFETLGVPLAQGRGFTLAEERGEEPPVAVISHDMWVRSGADSDVLGSVVRVNGMPLTVVGVAPRGFTGTMALIVTDVFMPLAAMERVRAIDGSAALRLQDPQSGVLMLIGRLAKGATAADADAELAAIAASSDSNFSDSSGDRYTYVTGKIARLSFGSAPGADEGLTADLILPAAMSGILLLIACLNLANMFLARGASRRTEIAIRQSLGCGRMRLIRQFLTEGLLLAILGGVSGLAWSYVATSWITASAAEILPLGLHLFADTRPDVTVLLVTAVACGIATLAFGLGPAWRVTGRDVLSGLKERGGAVRFGPRIAPTPLSGRNILMAGQIALTLAMLVAGGLFARSALFAAQSAPAFSLDRTLVIELDTSLAGYDETSSKALYAQILDRLRELPEVEGVGMTATVPFAGVVSMENVRPVGSPSDTGSHGTMRTTIGDGYFDSLRLPILRGRDFTFDEVYGQAARPVAIIDEPLARRLFPDSDALGRLIETGSSEPVVMEIVGVAPGTPGADFDPTPTPHLYVPLGQGYAPTMNLVVGVSDRAADPARVLGAIREEIRAIDPALPLLGAATMREVRDRNWLMWFVRIGAQLFTLLGVLALFVAMVGLYGMKAFLISRRTREIGVRMALGATRKAVLRQMMRESMSLTLAGIGAGLVLAFALGRILASFLYEVSATDPWALLGATAFLAAAAALAAWLPVLKAVRIEPSSALRYE